MVNEGLGFRYVRIELSTVLVGINIKYSNPTHGIKALARLMGIFVFQNLFYGFLF